MMGGSSGSNSSLSNYLLNFNSADWATQANQQLQNALNLGLTYGSQYNQQAANAVQGYQNQANTALQQGFNQSQALMAPQRLATYNALDAYTNSLGLPSPTGGSANLAGGLTATGQPGQYQVVNPSSQPTGLFNPPTTGAH